MDVAAVETFTSILAIAAAALAVCVIAGALLRSRSSAIDGLMTAIDEAALWLAFLVAAGATLGSLYFSEVADYIPCTLCWYQRIAMYPLAVILGIATFRRDRAIRLYAVPVAAVGLVIAAYHWLIERFPDLEAGGTCSAIVPCTAPWFTEFGFVTLSFMAFSGFALIIVALLLPTPQET